MYCGERERFVCVELCFSMFGFWHSRKISLRHAIANSCLICFDFKITNETNSSFTGRKRERDRECSTLITGRYFGVNVNYEFAKFRIYELDKNRSDWNWVSLGIFVTTVHLMQNALIFDFIRGWFNHIIAINLLFFIL